MKILSTKSIIKSEGEQISENELLLDLLTTRSANIYFTPSQEPVEFSKQIIYLTASGLNKQKKNENLIAVFNAEKMEREVDWTTRVRIFRNQLLL